MSKVASYVLALSTLSVAACGAVAPTAQPGTPSVSRTPFPTVTRAPSMSPAPTASSPQTSATPGATGSAAGLLTVSGTLVFIGDTSAPIVFDGATCKGVGNYAAIHDGAHLTFYDAADTGTSPTPIGDALISGGQPGNADCAFSFAGGVLPADNYVADIKIYQWQLAGPLQSPLHLRFRASAVGASASP